MADRHPAWDRIEPEAQGLARHHDIIPGEHAIELSKAISLKRIADAAEAIAACADGIHPSAFRVIQQS